MAWTDQCKISAVQTIDKIVEDMGVSVRKAIVEVSKEADIPKSTLKKWYYPGEKNGSKNGPTQNESDTEDNTNPELPKPIKKTYWKTIERRLGSIVDYMFEYNPPRTKKPTEELEKKIISHINTLEIQPWLNNAGVPRPVATKMKKALTKPLRSPDYMPDTNTGIFF